MVTAANRKRRVLLAYPRFTRNNLLNFEHMMPYYPGKTAVMPPLGLLEFGAMLRERFEARFIDENVRAVSEADMAWADVVAVSGMHPQRRRIDHLLAWARSRGKITVLGGPSVSICPEYYPQADALHVGEIGDATERLLQFLESATPPSGQLTFKTEHKTPIEELPLPAIELIDVNEYFTMPMQFSVGCPYTCEFCDIPMIYGRIARVKSGARIAAELEALYQRGFLGTVLFVDDNLIADRKALRAMLPGITEWQKRRHYPFQLQSEATINIAREPEILAALREARFTHLFVGVESPEPETLKEISKKQNVQDPLVDSLRVIQSYGMEVILGMIFGFDTDTDESGEKMASFVEAANGPIVYFNLLAALPKTPLWDRMVREGRLRTSGEGDRLRSEDLLSCLTTNVKYKLPLQVVRSMLRETVRRVYTPAEVYRRFTWNAENVYGRRLPGRPPTETWAQRRALVGFTLGTLRRVLVDSGWRAPYRDDFWKFALKLAQLRIQGRIDSILEVLLMVAPLAHHLAEWGKVLLEEGVRDEPEDEPMAAPAEPRPGAQAHRMDLKLPSPRTSV